MKKTAILALALLLAVLTGCAQSPGRDAPPEKTAQEAPAQTPWNTTAAEAPESVASRAHAIEEIAGYKPIDLVDSALSREYLPPLVKEAKRLNPNLETADAAPFKLFAAVPFEGGALMLAGTAISQHFPELFYIKDGKAIAINRGAEYFLLNYTVFKGHTICYGRMLGETAKGEWATVARGVFANGQEVSCRGKPYDEGPGIYGAGGYILVADGQTWLQSIAFYDDAGKKLSDQNDENLGWDRDDWYFKGTPLEVFNYQKLTQFETWGSPPKLCAATFGKAGQSAEMTSFFDDGMDASYLYRNCWTLARDMTAPPNTGFRVASYPPLEEHAEYEDRTDGTALPGDAEVYWLDLSYADGSQKDLYPPLQKGELKTPAKKGTYLLAIRAEGWYYAALIAVK